jgi:hypothetical protein
LSLHILRVLLAAQKSKNEICRTIIVPVVLYGCGTWSRSLREEHRLRVFENRVLMSIFGLKRDEIIGDGRRLYYEDST